MSDLISRKKVLDVISNWNDNESDIETLAFMIAGIPSEEHKKGKWIEQEDGWGGYYYDCSVCKESWTTIDGTPFDNGMKFCPNCGAEMERRSE